MKVRDETYQYYFYFMQERMNIFWKRFNGSDAALTEDSILSSFKFTNVYRILDRVSQFLVKEVIYANNDHFNEPDILLRILVFKVFNNIDTWQYLESKIGPLRISNFDVTTISILLAERIKETPIFSAAYMMAGSHRKYNLFESKHERWLKMIEQEVLAEKRLQRILTAKSLEEVYQILTECTFIGSFLAYQYAIDFNYSTAINFSENSFVKAGIGAIRGIKKCFIDVKNNAYEDCIKYTRDNLHSYQEKYGFTEFKPLFGREPTLIDLQNCFCETDKYLRVKMPLLQVGNIRIKQKFLSPKSEINFFFPPKWSLTKSHGN